MPTREEMRSLAEEIAGSYADRVAGIAQLRETVKMDLKGFQDSRTAMAKELRADLTKSVSDRKIAVSTQLKELDATHAAMSREMRAELNKGPQTLTEEEAKRQSEAREFMGELGRAVAEGKATVKTLLGEFNSSHNAMSREMRAELAKGHQALVEGEKKRQSEAREFMGELGRAVAEGKATVKNLLGEFNSSHAAMSREMRAELAKSVSTLKHEVGAMLKEVRSELAGGRDEWQILSATMQAHRVGAPVEVKPSLEETAEEAAEITPEIADIRDRVFEYLANHPDGTKLAKLEEEFGLARIQIAKIVKSLMDENKVEKRELFYFAI